MLCADLMLLDPNMSKHDQLKWKQILNQVLATALTIPDLSLISIKELLAISNVSEDQYEEAVFKNKHCLQTQTPTCKHRAL